VPPAVLVLAALTAAVPISAQTSRAQTVDSREEYIGLFVAVASDALRDPRLTTPMPCLPHWLATDEHEIVAVSGAAASALRPGDRIDRVEQIRLTGQAGRTWESALRALPRGTPSYRVELTRRGAPVRATLPCRADDARRMQEAEIAMWRSVVERNWMSCRANGEEMLRVFGAPFSPPLMIMTRCAAASDDGPDAALTGTLGLALLHEMVAQAAPSPDTREQLYLTLRELDAVGGPDGAAAAAALRDEMSRLGVAVPARR
jgi:hypothetical protein